MVEKDQARLHAFVEGRVQGVSFRYFVIHNANRYGVTGWVRNTHQGEVEVVAEGSRSDVERLLTDLRRGPSAALVTNVRSEWESYTGSFNTFEIEMTV